MKFNILCAFFKIIGKRLQFKNFTILGLAAFISMNSNSHADNCSEVPISDIASYKCNVNYFYTVVVDSSGAETGKCCKNDSGSQVEDAKLYKAMGADKTADQLNTNAGYAVAKRTTTFYQFGELLRDRSVAGFDFAWRKGQNSMYSFEFNKQDPPKSAVSSTTNMSDLTLDQYDKYSAYKRYIDPNDLKPATQYSE